MPSKEGYEGGDQRAAFASGVDISGVKTKRVGVKIRRQRSEKLSRSNFEINFLSAPKPCWNNWKMLNETSHALLYRSAISACCCSPDLGLKSAANTNKKLSLGDYFRNFCRLLIFRLFQRIVKIFFGSFTVLAKQEFRFLKHTSFSDD